jgi:hypothetical protein
MVDASVVLEKLKLLLPLAQQMGPAAQLLCEQAAQAFSSKLAQPAFAGDARITFAAAVLAGSWLVKCRLADETQQLSFRAGDVSITPSKNPDTQSRLAALLDEALAQAAPLLRDDGFAFWQIGL